MVVTRVTTPWLFYVCKAPLTEEEVRFHLRNMPYMYSGMSLSFGRCKNIRDAATSMLTMVLEWVAGLIPT